MSQDLHSHRILVLDFGSQYTQLIARRVREIGVYCEIYPYDVELSHIESFKPKAVILSGGPETVLGDDTPTVPGIIFDLGCPVLGICYGMQAMANQLGGEVQSSDVCEFGYAKVVHQNTSALLKGIADQSIESGGSELDVWMSHGDKVTQVPSGFEIIASTDSAPVAAMADEQRQFYGVQFHPEVTHTKQGLEIVERFVVDIAGCEKLWNVSNIVDDAVQRVAEQVGKEPVILGLSGGVDSSVVAMLLHKAIGDQLTCVFVDNGLLRLNEGDQVMKMFADSVGIKVIRVNAEDLFLNALKGVSDPEKKRKIIGNKFIEIFEQEAAKLDNVKWLAQGTIYPDVIESAGSKTGKAHLIKSHHNVGGLPEDMKLKLVEPLRELFKDEVRKMGMELGLPYDMVYRHPFPGPGLGVRILGEVNKQYADLLRAAL